MRQSRIGQPADPRNLLAVVDVAFLSRQRNNFNVTTGNDIDSVRHDILTPDATLINRNYYLAMAIQYLHGGKGLG